MFKSNCEVLGLWLWAQLGRQAAWRPRCIRIGVVWLVASCLQMLICVCLFGLGLWAQLGRQAAWRPWCIEMVSSGWWHCLAVAVVIACCGLWFWARARSSSCLAAEVHSNWCRLVSGIVFAVVVTGNCWDLGSGRGLNLVVWLFGDWCTIGLVDESSISQWAVRSSKFLEIVLGKQFLVGQSSRNLWCGSE